jgi:3-ketosteroid 9alpha-monooxygenase subunit A
MRFTGFPRGWFAACWSSELGTDGPRPLNYFDQHMVLWRDQDGVAQCIHAFCPHLGANLAIGGQIVEGRIQCPFHAWEFQGDGTCVHIPYIRNTMPKVPPQRTWPVVEKNGVVFIWHDAFGAAPEWEVPDIEDYGSDQWTPWYENQITVKTHPREIVENVADSAHFPVVHRTMVSKFENIYEDHKATQHTMGTATPPSGGSDTFDIWATYYGPAFQISDMKGYLHSRLFLAHTPISENELHLRFAVSLKRKGPKTEKFAKYYVENLRLGFHEDIDIWENKLFRERPRLCDGDGPIGKLRLWYSQFYKASGAAAAE